MTLNPYPHELNGPGTGCSEDCPACKFAAEMTPNGNIRESNRSDTRNCYRTVTRNKNV